MKNSHNIVQSYIDLLIKTHGMTKTDIATELGEVLDRPSYDIKRLNQWLRGDVSLPRPVYEIMHRELTPHTDNLTDEEKSVALSFPERTKR